jgi:NAD(P)H-dependent nitrite reductase small subunit
MTVSSKVWQSVCSVDDLIPYSGIAIKLDNTQVAIFYLPHLSPSVYAIANYDPFSNANVLARGLVGDFKGEICVVAPLYKQHFSLVTGICLDDDAVSVPTWECKVKNNQVALCV